MKVIHFGGGKKQKGTNSMRRSGVVHKGKTMTYSPKKVVPFCHHFPSSSPIAPHFPPFFSRGPSLLHPASCFQN